ncbi:hypothetical protein T492DRAFT_1086151 [Pavlovales sp. CCMP2436]|nr:hypothetical protein T492DRAFT_1086151 [Pavlovales sp. CCMP2436]
MATTADIGGGGCASDDDAPRVRPLRRLCWSCGDLLAVEPPREGLLATLCSARCPRCTAVTTALVPPTAAPPFPGLYERPAPLKLALRRVKRLLKRRRTPASTAERTHAGGPRYLVEWEEDATADYALLALGGGGGTELLPLSWEPELHVRLDPALVSHYHETRRPDKESVELAAPKPSAKPSTNAASLSLNGVGACPVMIELTVAAHLCTPSGEQPPAPRPPQIIWLPGDRVEVQWKGKGFRGSWALADVTKASRKQVHVRFAEFVIPGSRMAQWHPQLFAQTFSDQMATVLVFETARTPACCRGQLVLLGSHIVADVLHMLGAELAIDLVGKHVLCVPHAPAGSLGAALVELTARGLAEPVVRCLPNDTRVDLLVIDS